MPTLSRLFFSGSSSSTLNSEFVQYGKILNKVTIQNPNLQEQHAYDTPNKTTNNSASLLSNKTYNRFLSARPSVIYSLKNR